MQLGLQHRILGQSLARSFERFADLDDGRQHDAQRIRHAGINVDPCPSALVSRSRWSAGLPACVGRACAGALAGRLS